jgi:hypothetical protein
MPAPRRNRRRRELSSAALATPQGGRNKTRTPRRPGRGVLMRFTRCQYLRTQEQRPEKQTEQDIGLRGPESHAKPFNHLLGVVTLTGSCSRFAQVRKLLSSINGAIYSNRSKMSSTNTADPDAKQNHP